MEQFLFIMMWLFTGAFTAFALLGNPEVFISMALTRDYRDALGRIENPPMRQCLVFIAVLTAAGPISMFSVILLALMLRATVIIFSVVYPSRWQAILDQVEG